MKRTSVEQVRVNHRLKVLRALRDEGSQSRVQLCEAAELAPTTMSKLVAELIREGLVEESGTQALSGAGRPRLDLRLVAPSRSVLCLSIRPDGLQWAVVQLDLSVARSGALALPVAHTAPADTLAAATQLLREVAAAGAAERGEGPRGAWAAEGVDSENGPQRGQFLPDSQAHSSAMGQEAGEKWTAAAHLQPTPLLPPRLLGLVVTLPGAVDESLRLCRRAPLLGWAEVAVAEQLQAALGLPVLVHNNARAMALAELRHLGADCEPPLLYVQGRHGLAAAIIDRVASSLHGHYLLSELGNIPVQPHASHVHAPAGLRLGAVLNEPYLLHALGQPDGQALPTLEARARQGDASAQRLRTQTLHYLGIGLGIAVDLLNPRTIVLGGIYAQASDAFLDALLTEVRRVAFSELTQQLVLRRSALVGQGDLIGAAMIGMERFMGAQQ